MRFRFHQEEDGFEAEFLQHPEMSFPLRHTFPGWLLQLIFNNIHGNFKEIQPTKVLKNCHRFV